MSNDQGDQGDAAGRDDRFAEFLKAAQEGRVTTMTTDRAEDLLASDGDARLYLVRDSHLGPELFGLSLVDGGGFTGLVISRAQWAEMKKKVDDFLESTTT